MYKSHKYNGDKSSVSSYFKGSGSKYNTMRQIVSNKRIYGYIILPQTNYIFLKIILATLVVCCVAAPTSHLSSAEVKQHDILLQRPSPINPDVPSDPKPVEKITKITDPKEIVKHKRETEDNPYDHIARFAPTALPVRQIEKEHSQEINEHNVEADSTHHRQKRAEEQSTETKKSTKLTVPTPVPSHKAVIKKDSHNYASSPNTPTTLRSKVAAVPVPAPARDLPNSRQRRQVDPHLIGASTVPVTPLLYIDQKNKSNEDDVQGETNSEDPLASRIDEHSEIFDSESTEVPTPVKRDIPVPLVPKYHHPEESPKSNEKPEHVEKNYQQKSTSEGDNKSKESSESDESHEEFKEKEPVIQSQNFPIGQHQEPHIPAQVSHTAINKENVKVHTTPITEQDKPADVHNVTTAIEHANEPLVEQLGGIKPTQIIAYETTADKETVTIKHPIPVAELLSK